MFRNQVWIILVLAVLATLVWASDHITLQGERTIYSVSCEGGAWDGLRCTGRLAAGDRYRFRASSSRNEVVYWIAGSRTPSGKYTDCQVSSRDNWTCTAHPGQAPSVAVQLAQGRPISRGDGTALPCHAVAKWKWWALRAGIPGFTSADFSNASGPSSERAESRR